MKYPEHTFEVRPDRFDGTDPRSAEHHTGKPCVERGCDKPAGTWWSHLWCADCNDERLDRVSKSLEAMTR